MSDDSQEFSLALVGGGPRATYALERLAATIDRLDGRRLAVHVYELGGEFGAGQVHSTEQPHTSYLNRSGSQIAFAADHTVAGAAPVRPPRSARPCTSGAGSASRPTVTRPSTWSPASSRGGVNTARRSGRCSTAMSPSWPGCPGSR